jgi:serine/threonine protein kinase
MAEEIRVGDVLLDDYEVVAELGRGGMGVVYLVESRSTGVRYALKRSRSEHLETAALRRAFKRELLNWSMLPPHPNLVSLRFFRSAGKELFLFSEYVPGCDLGQLIREGRLLERARILEVARQMAVGLAAAHRAGILHQDVKPGNVLVTPEWQVKITDFGLSRARRAGGWGTGAGLAAGSGEAGTAATEYSHGGLTPAYCSPEQAEQRRLTRHTDIWSWGVCVLEMFNGAVTWNTGVQAPFVLDTLRLEGPADERLPLLDESVAAILRRCFAYEIGRRWHDLSVVAELLAAALGREAGPGHVADESKRTTDLLAEEAAEGPLYVRSSLSGGRWLDPAERRRRIYGAEAEGEDSAYALVGAASRRAHLIADLCELDDLEREVADLTDLGDGAAAREWLELPLDLALVLRELRDIGGALERCREAVSRAEQALEAGGALGARQVLAGALNLMGQLHLARRESRAALAAVDRAAEVCLAGVEEGSGGELSRALAWSRVLASYALYAAGKRREAMALSLEAERVIDAEGGSWSPAARAFLLAGALMNRASCLAGLGDTGAALSTVDRAIAVLEPEMGPGRAELLHAWCVAQLSRATYAQAEKRHEEVVAANERAAEGLSRLLREEGRRAVKPRMALANINAAMALSELGRFRRAEALAQRAIEELRDGIELEGDNTLLPRLADAHRARGIALWRRGELSAAIAAFERGIAIIERLAPRERTPGVDLATAEALMSCGKALQESGRPREALAMYDRAAEICGSSGARASATWLYFLRSRLLVNRTTALVELGELAGAESELERGFAELETLRAPGGTDDPELIRACLHKIQAAAAEQRGAFVEAERAVRRAEEHLGRIGDTEPVHVRQLRLELSVLLARTLIGQGRHGPGLRVSEQAVARAVALEQEWEGSIALLRADAERAHCRALGLLGRHREALQGLEASISMLAATGDSSPGPAMRARLGLAWADRAEVLLALERPAEALAAAKQAMGIADSVGESGETVAGRELPGWALIQLTRALAATGRIEEARRARERALDTLARRQAEAESTVLGEQLEQARALARQLRCSE